MTDNFFDTSALGKHYHPEVGTPEVDQLLGQPESHHFISRLTVIEIQSVFAKKVRTGILNLADFQLLTRRFLADVRKRRFLVVRLTAAHFQKAEQLIRNRSPTQSLRTLDALQLAAALDLQGRGLVSQFVCADQGLCALASIEGLAVLNPEVP